MVSAYLIVKHAYHVNPHEFKSGLPIKRMGQSVWNWYWRFNSFATNFQLPCLTYQNLLVPVAMTVQNFVAVWLNHQIKILRETWYWCVFCSRSTHYDVSVSEFRWMSSAKDVHPCDKLIGFLFQNQIWSRSLAIDMLCLILPYKIQWRS